jgi:hypothetical protein
MVTKEEMMLDEYTLLKTEEYKRLLKAEKHLMSIREGRDYNWLVGVYSDIDAFIDDMEVIKFGIPEEGENDDK